METSSVQTILAQQVHSSATITPLRTERVVSTVLAWAVMRVAARLLVSLAWVRMMRLRLRLRLLALVFVGLKFSLR